ncbi:hypothetical protein ACTGZQ_00725 [Streptococcus suis]
MSEKQNKALTLEEYLQVRNESCLATILFCIYTILFTVGGFYLVSQGGRAYLYTSIGITVYLALGMRVFIPPFHKKAYLELAQPELKTYPSQKALISSRFLFGQLGAYGLGCIVLLILLVQSLSAIQPKVEMIDLPTLKTSTTESSTTPPSLKIDNE